MQQTTPASAISLSQFTFPSSVDKQKYEHLIHSLTSSKSKHSNEAVNNPYNWHQFQERVKSFSGTNWYDKPYSINPLRCARYGFANTRTDIISCVDCAVSLCFKNTIGGTITTTTGGTSPVKHLSQEALELQAQKFVKKLEDPETHKRDCAYYGRASPADFARFLPQTHRVLNWFQTQYNRCAKLNPTVQISPSFISQYFNKTNQENSSEQTNSSGSSSSSDMSQLAETVHDPAYYITAFGWKTAVAQQRDHLVFYCQKCQMRYIVNNVTKKINNREDEFNPCTSHRWWCPWIYTSETVVPGWKEVLQVLEKEKHKLSLDSSASTSNGAQMLSPQNNRKRNDAYDKLLSVHRLLNESISVSFLQKKRNLQSEEEAAAVLFFPMTPTTKRIVEAPNDEITCEPRTPERIVDVPLTITTPNIETTTFPSASAEPLSSEPTTESNKEAQPTQSEEIMQEAPVELEKLMEPIPEQQTEQEPAQTLPVPPTSTLRSISPTPALPQPESRNVEKETAVPATSAASSSSEMTPSTSTPAQESNAKPPKKLAPAAPKQQQQNKVTKQTKRRFPAKTQGAQQAKKKQRKR